MNRANVKQILLSGIAGGIVLNLIDTPWSVLVMVPRMQPFLESHGLESHPMTGPWFLLSHVVFAIGIAWVYSRIRPEFERCFEPAMIAGGVLLVLNRMFGFGNVLMGTLPAPIFAGFSASFAIGTLAAAWVAGYSLDRWMGASKSQEPLG